MDRVMNASRKLSGRSNNEWRNVERSMCYMQWKMESPLPFCTLYRVKDEAVNIYTSVLQYLNLLTWLLLAMNFVLQFNKAQKHYFELLERSKLELMSYVP